MAAAIVGMTLDICHALADQPLLERLTSSSLLVRMKDQPKTVTLLAQVPVGSPLPQSITAVRRDPSGRVTARLGELLDSGELGDVVKGDNVYSRNINIDEKEPTWFTWGVELRFAGENSPVTLQAPAIVVQADQTCLEALQRLAEALEKRDMNTAATLFHDQADADVLKAATEESRQMIAAGLRRASIRKSDDRSCIATVPEKDGETERRINFNLIRSPFGLWVITVW